MLNDAFFVSTQVHEKQVKLADGSEHTLYFKELPAIEFRKFFLAEQSEDEDVRAAALAKLISFGLCEPDGKAAITFNQALMLKTDAMNAIAAAILEVNQPKKA